MGVDADVPLEYENTIGVLLLIPEQREYEVDGSLGVPCASISSHERAIFLIRNTIAAVDIHQIKHFVCIVHRQFVCNFLELFPTENIHMMPIDTECIVAVVVVGYVT